MGTNAGAYVQSESPLVFWEGRHRFSHLAFEAVQYPDATNYKTTKLRMKNYRHPDRWVTPFGGIRPWVSHEQTSGLRAGCTRSSACYPHAPPIDACTMHAHDTLTLCRCC